MKHREQSVVARRDNKPRSSIQQHVEPSESGSRASNSEQRQTRQNPTAANRAPGMKSNSIRVTIELGRQLSCDSQNIRTN